MTDVAALDPEEVMGQTAEVQAQDTEGEPSTPPAPPAEEGAPPSEPTVPRGTPDVPEKFWGKPWREVAASYRAVEEEKGRLAEQIGELRGKAEPVPTAEETARQEKVARVQPIAQERYDEAMADKRGLMEALNYDGADIEAALERVKDETWKRAASRAWQEDDRMEQRIAAVSSKFEQETATLAVPQGIARGAERILSGLEITEISAQELADAMTGSVDLAEFRRLPQETQDNVLANAAKILAFDKGLAARKGTRPAPPAAEPPVQTGVQGSRKAPASVPPDVLAEAQQLVQWSPERFRGEDGLKKAIRAVQGQYGGTK